ncbi:MULTISPECIES: hypothetical protein [Providencia]|uniref:hypothetical protein n=1 Tax=Providencia TaxID=586 RepID=UPI001B38B9F2|nr:MULTISPECIES: hypothetical protein [Providencia]MBQ0263472.1 hypothetical protein [Providencia rettgeri]MCB4853715.1 hypothetical protein [Providencia rettgeri]MCD6314389.1 hypothetical protein [Providencia rettgeri]MCS4542584.1 hypothetical protein [Providencia rettgeri]MCX9110607.1 hypothetical protein [Providencia rettgeri]
MWKLLAALLAATIMIASNSALAADRNLTKEEEAKVISLIKNHLKLPATAKFKFGKMISNPYDAYCVAVAKSNKEFIPFIISMPEPVRSIDLRQVIMAGDNEYKYRSVIEQCAEYGYQLN